MECLSVRQVPEGSRPVASKGRKAVANHRALQDKVAIITGAASGIGAATAERFVKEGASVVLSDLDGDGAIQLARRLGPKAVGIGGNHCSDSDNARVVDEALRRFGHVDILHNNAGMAARGAFDALEERTLRAVLDVNLIGPFLMSRACLPALRNSASAGRGPCILFTASIQSIMVRAGFSVYAASKHGIAGLACALSLELAEQGIRVNAICPGPVDTPLFRAAVKGAANGPGLGLEGLVASVPMKRLIGLDEVASAATFLCSDQSSAITGVMLPVDGGVTAR